ncbi:d-isomer specific 2-hydroxyacid dehydrogenase, NAD binding domain-containing protein [Trichoderma breve]|uniref:D-isomer specific 2-hydroxyacid dehydrogenase, NAD binding domain-containing protein n=1 Tax=Trichoderma breve TaxID=2034170 RepID=A0A9W9BB39_9HYPO|nr:d-isomer specific 2-hydroxyacid dehydrogenase, NAD binding domain-containing protein [Trichoderma breve]KAJ4858069.1 d-isomer specific 2-hydroxyacid dehydrogenase, NAD binding domain-containing protein [Trichoderma breve]
MAHRIQVAILDDYQGIAEPIFRQVMPEIEIRTFSDTIQLSTPEDSDALVHRLQPYNVISTMRERTPFPKEIIKRLPKLDLLLTTGMKNSAIDLAACTEQGIAVVGAKGLGKDTKETPPTSLDSTLEHCWALILGLARNISRDDLGVKTGHWETSHATGLRGKTLGLLGFGTLGARVAFVADEKAASFSLPPGSFKVAGTKEELLQNSDVLSIHYVLSERSRNILGSSELALMKPSAILINTSRSALVNEQALLDTLLQGKIRGAALDVHNVEPLPQNSPWRVTSWGTEGRSQLLLSPHMGYVEEGVMTRWYQDSAMNLKTWAEGKDLLTKLN